MLNATFASTMARPGHLGFISQSGALCTAILDWSRREMVGFSAFVSVGSMLDVGWGDLIQYLGDDPKTRSIVMYMESVGDARSFLSAAREVALSKPIIVIKPGRTEAAAKAAASHTGALTGPGRRARRGFSPMRRAARGHHRGAVLSGRSARQAAAPQGSAPGDRDQRGRSGGARHRRAAHREAANWPSFRPRPSTAARCVPAAALEPSESRSTFWETPAPSATRRPWISRSKIPAPMARW